MPTKTSGSEGPAEPRVGLTYLVTHMQGKEEHQHPCGRVASVVLCPPVVDVLEEGWVVDLNLGRRDNSNMRLEPGAE